MADSDGKYFRLDITKIELDILDTDEVDDAWLVERGLQQDVVIDNDLAEFLGVTPVLDADVTEDLTHLSTYGVARRYKIKIKDFETGKEYEKLYNEGLLGIKNKLKSRPTTRTTRISVSKAYRTEPQASDF